MNRNLSLRFVFVLLLVSVVGMAGCRKRSNHTSVAPPDDDIFTTDEFPGAPVQEGNLAADQRAMSDSGGSAIGIQCTFDGTRGTAIATYTSVAQPLGSGYHVYAHFFDGTHWTPPVALDALDTDLSQPCGAQAIVFFNTDDDRNGDALIFWIAFDVGGSAPGDGANSALFATYFDASSAGDSARRHGFQRLAERLDSLDGPGENVNSFAVVSDGLHGEHAFPGGSVRGGGIAIGDQTTGVVACWTQLQDNDVLNPAAEDQALWYASWTLPGPADPELPLIPTPATRLPILGFGASDAGLSSEETLVGQRFVVYNNLLFFLTAANQIPISGIPGVNFPPTSLTAMFGTPFGAEDDVTIQVVAFDLSTGVPSATQSLAIAPPDATDSLGTMMAFLYETDLGAYGRKTPSCFGSDEGLAQCVIVTLELDADADTTVFGSGFQDGYLKLTGLDEATGTVHGAALVSVDNPAIYDSIDAGHVAVQISRNGDYLWLAWLQPDAAGAFDDLSLRVSQFVTTRIGSTIPPVSLATSPPLSPDMDVDGFGVGWLCFQDALGYICGAQSDPDVMNLFIEHGSAAYDRVIDFRLHADLAIPPSPTVSIFPVASFEEGDMAAPPLNPLRLNFASADAGADGDAIVFYRADIDSSAGTDFRLFARRVGPAPATVEIGSAVDGRQIPHQGLVVVVTPAGEEIGVFDVASGEDSAERAHPAGDVHVLFREDRSTNTPGVGPALRARVFSAGDPLAAVGDIFTPSAGSDFQPPFDLDLPGIAPAPAQAAFLLGVARDGGSVGVWFAETGHLFYQEFDPEGRRWRETDGASDPALIDDDSPVEAEPVPLFVTLPGNCESLHGATLFWRKDLDGSGVSFRLQVRVRD